MRACHFTCSSKRSADLRSNEFMLPLSIGANLDTFESRVMSSRRRRSSQSTLTYSYPRLGQISKIQGKTAVSAQWNQHQHHNAIDSHNSNPTNVHCQHEVHCRPPHLLCRQRLSLCPCWKCRPSFDFFECRFRSSCQWRHVVQPCLP